MRSVVVEGSHECKIRISNCARNPPQRLFVDSNVKRIVVRAGRRGGKTQGVSIRAINRFLAGRRVLYAAPTQDQVESSWHYVKQALAEPIAAGIFIKNETRHTIELPGTKQRIRCKTAWNADTLRGDYADDLMLDEFQLMNENIWGLVGAPMLADNNGDATFIYTPPSLHSRSVSKANDPQHAAKLFKYAQADKSGRWTTFHWSSRENGYISAKALKEIAGDMTNLAYRMEIEAEDIDEAPGALWRRDEIDKHRLPENAEYDLVRIVVGVDPTGSASGDEAGIVAAGRNGDEYFILEDRSLHGRPEQWATAAVKLYHDLQADCIVAEKNYGGEMVEHTIRTVDSNVNIKAVNASHGKAVRAEPIAAIYEQGRGHHIGVFPKLEDEMCLWCPGDKSPNHLDACVWAMTELYTGFIREPGECGVFL